MKFNENMFLCVAYKAVEVDFSLLNSYPSLVYLGYFAHWGLFFLMVFSFFCPTPCFSFQSWRHLWFQVNRNATLLSVAQHTKLSAFSGVPKCRSLCCSLWLFLIAFTQLAPCFHECAHQWGKI